jgi:WD repeat-containing protein 61
MKIEVRKLFSMEGHQDCVYGLSPGAAPYYVYSAGGDGMVVQWNLNDPENGHLVAKMNNAVYALCYEPHSKLLLVGQNYEGVHFLDTTTSKEIAAVPISNERIFDIKQYRNHVFVGSADGTLYVLDFERKALLKTMKLSDKSIRVMSINRELGHLAIGLSDNTIRIIDLQNLQPKHLISAHKLSVFALAYDPNTNNLISGSRDAHLKFWFGSDSYRFSHSIVAHMFAINSISLDFSGKYFVSCSMDKSIKVWDLGSGQLLKVIDKSRHAGHATSVNKVLWTNHKNLVVSCSDDRKVSVWELGFK